MADAVDPNEEHRVTRPRRYGFTTIELLITLAILVILAGLVFIGFKAVTIGGRTRSTRSTLELVKSLMNEVEIAKGLPYVKSIYKSPPNGSAAQDFYYFAFPPLPASTPAGAPIGTPSPPVPTPISAKLYSRKAAAIQTGNVSEDLYNAATNDVRYQSVAVIRTQMVMQRIQAITANRTALAQLPARSFLTWNSATAPPSGPAATVLQIPLVQVSPPRYAPNAPLLIDAWGNPIIFVPPAGLAGVHFKDDPTATTTHVVTSTRVRSTYTTGVTDPRSAGYGNFDPGATSFWASAGPDGDFTTGDDNVYSFEGF